MSESEWEDIIIHIEKPRGKVQEKELSLVWQMYSTINVTTLNETDRMKKSFQRGVFISGEKKEWKTEEKRKWKKDFWGRQSQREKLLYKRKNKKNEKSAEQGRMW